MSLESVIHLLDPGKIYGDFPGLRYIQAMLAVPNTSNDNGVKMGPQLGRVILNGLRLVAFFCLRRRLLLSIEEKEDHQQIKVVPEGTTHPITLIDATASPAGTSRIAKSSDHLVISTRPDRDLNKVSSRW